jgi:hypothetical protein
MCSVLKHASHTYIHTRVVESIPVHVKGVLYSPLLLYKQQRYQVHELRVLHLSLCVCLCVLCCVHRAYIVHVVQYMSESRYTHCTYPTVHHTSHTCIIAHLHAPTINITHALHTYPSLYPHVSRYLPHTLQIPPLTSYIPTQTRFREGVVVDTGRQAQESSRLMTRPASHGL